MQEKSWPNFSKKLISQVGNVIKSGKINYTTGQKEDVLSNMN